MLLGYNLLTNEIHQWLIENGWEEIGVGLDEDFYYEDIEEKIYVALTIAEKHDRLFEQVFNEIGLQHKCDNFILSFFHELGHYETLHLLTEEEEKLSEKIYNKPSYEDSDYLEYYYSPREIIATTWAKDFINENVDKVKDFWNRIQPIIFQLYDMNEVDV